MKKLIYGSLVVFYSLFVVSCNNDDDVSVDTRQFGVFTVQEGDTIVQMSGVIGSSTLTDFNNLIINFPNIKGIDMVEVPGSEDDVTNLQVSQLVHQNDIRTHVVDAGLIASGGVDFFLAGTKRTIGSNVRIGVHSWSDGVREATDFPVDDPEHDLYLNYYEAIGFTEEQSRDFYFFTINAAPAADIHFMTIEEIEQFNVLTE